MNGMKKQWLICLILPLILLSGCGLTLTSAANAVEEPTILQVQRVNTETENHYLPFAPRTITNQQLVQHLYHAMQALPQFSTPDSPGSLSCPREIGVQYQLVFLHEHSVMQKAIYDPSGCSRIWIGQNDVRAADKPFAQLFAQTIGIPETDLVPVPLFSCNFRSPCPSPTP